MSERKRPGPTAVPEGSDKSADEAQQGEFFNEEERALSTPPHMRRTLADPPLGTAGM